jgi:DNA-binding transcriptional ArsR family regulator
MRTEMDDIFEALSDPMRREIFERIVIRPRRVGELGALLPITRQAVSHHVGVLGRAGLIHQDARRLEVVVEALPRVRSYFDRLWLEASLGDTWLAERARFQTDDKS